MYHLMYAVFRGIIVQFTGQSPEKIEAKSSEENNLILQELQIHQIELKMQNEELRLAQIEIDSPRNVTSTCTNWPR